MPLPSMSTAATPSVVTVADLDRRALDAWITRPEPEPTDECGTCHGEGMVSRAGTGENLTCPGCEGRGTVPAEPELELEADEPNDLLDRMEALAEELMDPLVCRQPAYGAPGHPHCAACCYGTGYVITSEADQAVLAAARALSHAVTVIRTEGASGG